MLDLIELSGSQIRKLQDGRLIYQRLRHADEPIVGDRAILLGLARDDHADQTRCDEAAWESRLVHDHQHIKCVTVFATSSGYRAEIVWKDISGRQDAGKLEAIQRFVELELVTAATGRVNNDIYEPCSGFPRGKSQSSEIMQTP